MKNKKHTLHFKIEDKDGDDKGKMGSYEKELDK